MKAKKVNAKKHASDSDSDNDSNNWSDSDWI